MTADLSVTFPAAHRSGGVERVALEVVLRYAATHAVTFVGERFDPQQPTRAGFERVECLPVPSAWRPVEFRRAAGVALSRVAARTMLSFGVNCPPGDVYWVQSVHRAWLESGSSVSLRGVRVPSGARKLLPRHQALLALERNYFTKHRPRAILCTSQREVDDLHRLYGVPRDVMHVIPNGFDGARFNTSSRLSRREELRRGLGLDGDHTHLLFPVNELHRKGFDVLLAAMSRRQFDQTQLHVVGRAPIDGYASRIERLGLTSRVIYHGSTDRVEDFMSACDLMVLPTQYEPFGLVIVEALATGLPVITTALAGAATAVTADCGGLMADPHDVEELVALLERGLAELDLWTAAAPACASQYEWSRVLADAEHLIFES